MTRPARHRGLWSLLDMLKQNAVGYLTIGQRISDARGIFTFMDAAEPGTPEKHLSDDERAQLVEDLNALKRLCDTMEMPVSAKLFETAANDPPQTGREFDVMIAAFYAEIDSKLLIWVTTEGAPYFDKEILDGPTQGAFPSAYTELRAASRCYALELYTACVFHTMRAAESGVRVLAADLGVTYQTFPIELADWNDLLGQIEAKIKAIGQTPKSAKKDEDLAFYSPAASEFRWLKDGWRVRVAHARATYDQADSKKILEHVADFFGVLAKRLRE